VNESVIEGIGEQGAEENIGPKRKEVAGEWRRLHNEELHNLYVSPNVITVIKSRRMKQTGMQDARER
jgi:hypothetical protein